jgi:excisionase family DNA binding protein
MAHKSLTDSITIADNPIFLNKQEVADLLRCSLGTINNLIKQGKLVPYGVNRRVIFSKKEVLNALIRRA